MQAIRRIYLYTVVSVSLEAILWAAIALLRTILVNGGVGAELDRLAESLSLILVGLPVFLLHLWLAQRSAIRDIEERSASLRAVFIYGILLATLIPATINTLALINRLFLASLRLDVAHALIGSTQQTSDNFIAIGANALAAGLFYTLLRSNWRQPLQGEAFAEIRRLYRYLWLIFGLALGLLGIQQFIKFLVEIALLSQPEVHPLLANSMTLLLVGAPLWIFVNGRIQASLTSGVERGALTRLAVLYTLVFIGVGGTLISADAMIRAGLRWLFGEPLGLPDFVARLQQPISIALPLAGLWIHYSRRLVAEINALEDSPWRRGLRGAYYYVLALVGLMAAFSGLQMSLAVGLEVALAGTSLLEEASHQGLSSGVSQLALGLPLWLLAWRPMVIEAARQGEVGDHARRSLVRRAYLFLVLFIGVVGAMFNAGELLFQLLKGWLGEPGVGARLPILESVNSMTLFTALLGYHAWVLRSDERRSLTWLGKRRSQYPVLVLLPEEEDFAHTIVSALERHVPGLPVALHSISQGTPDETLSAAKAVILPAELAARPSEALRLWLQGFEGPRLVVPTNTNGWHWISGSGRPLPELAHQTAQAVRNLAEGETNLPARQSSSWLTLVYILAALFTIELLGAIGWLAVTIAAR